MLICLVKLLYIEEIFIFFHRISSEFEVSIIFYFLLLLLFIVLILLDRGRWIKNEPIDHMRIRVTNECADDCR